jgi:hypothetical protein
MSTFNTSTSTNRNTGAKPSNLPSARGSANNGRYNNVKDLDLGSIYIPASLRNTPVMESAKQNPVIALVVFILIIILLYFAGTYLWAFYKDNQTKIISKPLLTSVNNGQSQYDIGSSDMPNSSYSNEYSLSFWVYVDDYSYRQGQPKFLLRRGSTKTTVNPEIYLHPSQNTLQVNISMIPESTAPSTTTTTTTSTIAETSTTTTTTAPPAGTGSGSGFKDIKVENFASGVNSTCDCDQVKTPEDILAKLSENNPKVPNVYDPQFFDMVSGNEVPTGVKQSPELNTVLEGFQSAPDTTTTTTTTAPVDTKCDCGPTRDDGDTSDRVAFEKNIGKCQVTDFPLQKWVHVVVSQYNQVVDIYIDGKLKSSCVLPRFPDIVQDDLILSPNDGFSGQMSKVEYINSALSASKVYDLYAMGPTAGTAGLLDNIPNWVWIVLAIVVIGVIVFTLV